MAVGSLPPICNAAERHAALQTLSEKSAASPSKLVQIGGRFGFDVTADQGFGAARAEGHPFIARQQVLEAISGDEFFHLERSDGGKSGAEPGQQSLLALK